MSRLKKEILSKLKEYAGKMGKDHLGGDDSPSPKRGGLRDFDGYDNVDYNKDMPMDEDSPESAHPQGSKKLSGRTTVMDMLDVISHKEFGPDYHKLSTKQKKEVHKLAIKGKLIKQSPFKESVNEADITIGGKEYNLKKSGSKITLINKKLSADKFIFKNVKDFKAWADDQVEPIGGTQSSHFGINEGRLSSKDAKKLSIGSKIKTKKHTYTIKGFGNKANAFRQFEVENEKGDSFNIQVSLYGTNDIEVAKGRSLVFRDTEMLESIEESMFSMIDQIRQDSKDVRDFVKNVFKDREFKKMSNDKEFIKYLKSIYEGINEAIPQNFHQGRTSDYHTALRGKNRDYSGGTNFKKKNHGQPDVEEDDEDQETNQLSNKQIHVKAKLKVAESGKKKSEKNYKDWKSTNEGFDKIEHLSLLNKALRAIPGSNKQKDIIRQLNVIRKAGGMRPLKELSIVEYGQRLDLSFIEDEEAKLDGTYPSTDAIDRDIDETAKRDYKDEYKKFQSSKKSKKYRAELNKYNRDKGTYGNGDGKDASHKGGKIVGFESASKNRGRKEKSRLKKK